MKEGEEGMESEGEERVRESERGGREGERGGVKWGGAPICKKKVVICKTAGCSRRNIQVTFAEMISLIKWNRILTLSLCRIVTPDTNIK